MDFNQPTISGNYATGYTDVIVAHQKELAQWLDSAVVSVSNPVAHVKRYNATNQVFERRNAGNTAWEELPLAYAKIASPAFTGTPTAPTAAADTNTTQLATTAFVLGQAGNATPAMNGTAAAGTSPRYARQDHVHPTDTTRAPLASPNFSGTPTVSGNTIWHAGNFNPASYAPLSSPNFSGTPQVSGNTIWHAGNDGASSGLDADLLDGLQGSAFAQLNSSPDFSGRVFGRGSSGNNGLGKIIVQAGGTPPAMSQGDICFIY